MQNGNRASTAGEVERMLGIDDDDLRTAAPGLVRMNTIVIPRARAVSFAFAFVLVLLHNQLVFGRLDAEMLVPLGLFLAAWAFGSWWILVRFFATSPIHLGDLFVWCEIPILGLLVWATGGGESMIWPVFFIRIADQMWISRRRALWATLGGMAAAAVAFQAGGWSGYELDWGIEGFKLLAIGAMGAVLAAVAGAPWEVRDRTLRARELILELEDRSAALEEERRAAARANRAKTDFLARVSQELRIPMNAIIAAGAALEQSTSRSSRDGDRLRELRRHSGNLLALINDVIDLSRIEAGELSVREEAVDIATLVEQVTELLEARTEGRPVTLHAVVPVVVKPIRGDETRLRQILIQLIGNAIEYTEKGQVEVQLQVAPDGDPAAVHVIDTGPGIQAEVLEGLFDPFDLLGHHDAPAGTGFGLAVSRSLCQLMGFHLTVRSRPGSGSTFSVHFRPPPDEPGRIPTSEEIGPSEETSTRDARRGGSPE